MRRGRQALVDDLLPHLRITPTTDGSPCDPRLLFGDAARPAWLEIGYGAGEHLIHQAESHPDIGLIGCEPFINGVAKVLSVIDARGLTNIRLHDDDARLLLPRLVPASIERVFLLYPDPWPKRRHWNRRFVCRENLDLLSQVMADGAELRFATDHMGYARWALWHIRRHPDFVWTARRPGDWQTRPNDMIETRYEAKALAGRTFTYLTARRVVR